MCVCVCVCVFMVFPCLLLFVNLSALTGEIKISIIITRRYHQKARGLTAAFADVADFLPTSTKNITEQLNKLL